jgi:hypothetical protein
MVMAQKPHILHARVLIASVTSNPVDYNTDVQRSIIHSFISDIYTILYFLSRGVDVLHSRLEVGAANRLPGIG